MLIRCLALMRRNKLAMEGWRGAGSRKIKLDPATTLAEHFNVVKSRSYGPPLRAVPASTGGSAFVSQRQLLPSIF